MTETRTVHDPFLGKDVQVSDNLVDRLRADLDLCRAERDAADQVSLTAKRYVGAMEARLNEAVDLLRPLAALGPICDHFIHPNNKTICGFTIKGERRFGPTAGECRAAHDFIEHVEATKQ